MDTPLGLLAVVFLAVLASHSGEATSDCYVKVVPASNTLFLHKNDDVSIVCDASCFGRQNHGRVTWYGPGGNPIPRSHSGRMFQMIYNRNMFSRLFLFRTREEDSGTYTCSVGEGDDVKIATIFLDISDGYIRPGEWGLDSGRGRGDVSILVPTLPPLSPLRRRRAVPRVQRDADGSGGDDETQGTTETDTTNVDPTTASTDSTATTDSKTSQASISSQPNSDSKQTTTPTPSTTMTAEAIDGVGESSAASSGPPQTKQFSNGNSQQSPTFHESQPKKDNKIDCPTPHPTPAPTPATTRAYDLQHYFGSQGVIYFVVTLAIALLLAYTLVLVLYHHHCSRRQQATGSSEDKKREKERKNAEKAEKKRREKELKEQKEKERQEAKERKEKERQEAKEREKEAKAKQKLESESSTVQCVAMKDIADQDWAAMEGAENKGGNNQDVTIDLDGSEAATKATSEPTEAVASAAEGSGSAEDGAKDEKDELAEAVMSLLATPGTTTAEVCEPPKEAGKEDGEKKDNKTDEASPGTVAAIPPAPPLPADSGGQGSEEGKDGDGEKNEQDKGSDEKSPDE